MTTTTPPTLYEIVVNDIQGQPVSMSKYRGQAMLIVNTASKCGFTPQYEGLQKLHETYEQRGLAVLGFPCNQFGAQEPGSEEEIQSFCKLNYKVTFPIFAKLDVNGEDAHPLFNWLRQAAPGILGTEAIKWNFTKFLVDRQGNVQRFAPTTKRADLESEIERLLG